MKSWAALLTLAGLLLSQPEAQAHGRGTSYSFWTIGESAISVRARVSQLELTRLQLDPAASEYAERVPRVVSEQVQLWAGAERCTPAKAKLLAAEAGWVNVGWELQCAARRDLDVRSQLLHEVAPSHLHFARVLLPDGEVRQRVLTYAEPTMPLMTAPAAPASFGRYVLLGVEHILSGWDHLAFVLALVLLAASLREVAVVATGFTVAHSLTLAAAVLGWVQTRAEVVEALIGFSIALVAIEVLWLRSGRERWLPWTLGLCLIALALTGATQLPTIVLSGLALFTLCYFALLRQTQQPARLRLALAFIFGLVHGFGFAGVMAELRLPASQLAVGLLGFNTGVELGQLAVLALAWPMLQVLQRRPHLAQWSRDGGAALICALGSYWFLLRGIAQ